MATDMLTWKRAVVIMRRGTEAPLIDQATLERKNQVQAATLMSS
jgi:hypothetical protein